MDSVLWSLVQVDDHAAFKQLMERYWASLHKQVLMKIKDPDHAADIVQDLFLGLWKNRLHINCDDQGSLRPYLFKSIKYAVINHFTRPGITLRGTSILENALSYPSTIRTDELVLVKELNQLVNLELDSLPDRLKIPYQLSREQQLSIKQIAQQLNVSEQTVKNNISIVLQRIRLKVREYQTDPSIAFALAAMTILKHVN